MKMRLIYSFISFYILEYIRAEFVIDSGPIARKQSENIHDWQPQQVHIAYGEKPDQMVVTWVTIDYTHINVIDYGTKQFDRNAKVRSSELIDGGDAQRSIWIHRATLDDLDEETRYIYRVGSLYGYSEAFSFKMVKNDSDVPIRFAVYGDMGVENAQSLPRLQKETEDGLYDAILHIGDFAYDMHVDDGRIGDRFMQLIQPIAAYVPYMVCPGNHENSYNFLHYKNRFSMPNHEKTESMYYSWNLGAIHFIGIDTEAFYFTEYGLGQITDLYYWLENDLKEATRPEVRSVRPWIILYGHRPMYCTDWNHDDCTKKNCKTRVGITVFKLFGLEKLLYIYGVDLVLWAHEHNYERLWPVYDGAVLNGSMEAPYTDPRGPVHLITGSAGCKEHHDNFWPFKPTWSAYRNMDYGYTRFTVHNKTHIYWEQVSDDKNGSLVDQVWLIRNNHVPYGEV